MVSTQAPVDANVPRAAETGLGRLAAWCYDHRRRVLAGWLLAVVAIIELAQRAGSRLDNNFALAGLPPQPLDYRRAVRAWIPRLHPWTPGQPARPGM
jgi:hypothetical protein